MVLYTYPLHETAHHNYTPSTELPEGTGGQLSDPVSTAEA